MSKIKAIIFDMDGVLIDAKEWHRNAFVSALLHFGYDVSSEISEDFEGLPTKKKLEILSVKKGLPKNLHESINKLKQTYTIEFINSNCKPLAIHQEALSKLKGEGYRLALASNSIRSTIDLMLEKADLNKYFEFTLSNQDVKEPKPNPEIYLKTLEKLGLKSDECLVVEDSPNGIEAATKSGAHVLEVKSVFDVTYQNVKNKINQIEQSLIMENVK
ncbi:MAG: HAD family phosphatase [bacterium]|nr:HAD family phosphatase [bacterium]